jgi:DNA-binding IclR family transcriptional regulator
VAPEQEAVLELLQDHGLSMSTGEIAEALGKTSQNTYNILNRLKKQGKIISPKYGRWEVTLTSYTSPSEDGLTQVTQPFLKSVSVSSVTGLSEATLVEPEIW